MSTRPARATARVAPRPDVRRWILIAATVATAAAAFTSLAGAQSAPEQALAMSVGTETDQQPEVAAASVGTLAATARVVSSSAPAGPRLHDGLVAYKPAVTSQFEALAANEREMNRPASRRSAALIVVGLSAMVIGSFVDDDAGSIIVLGGAGVTLYGLWQYLK